MKTKLYLAGHRGMVGSAILRLLKLKNNFEIITRTHEELDLTNQKNVRKFFQSEQPEIVILAAAKVGGIHANNSFQADFIYENLMIESNIIHQSFKSGVHKLLQLGSSCIYPRLATQPIKESELLSGPLEPTNEPYAIAKIAGIKLCESYNRQYGLDYRSVMPTNLYGPGDNFHPENSHVLPALLSRFHFAKKQSLSEVTIWGSGKPRREFMHVDDMAEASMFVLNISKELYAANTTATNSHINIGTGKDISIIELASLIADITGFRGSIKYDTSKPDGTPRKLLDVKRMSKIGWESKIGLRDGIVKTYEWFIENQDNLRT